MGIWGVNGIRSTGRLGRCQVDYPFRPFQPPQPDKKMTLEARSSSRPRRSVRPAWSFAKSIGIVREEEYSAYLANKLGRVLA